MNPLDADLVREDGTRTFAINELAVRAPARRRGVAAAMHARLLSGLDAERVTLLVRPEAEAAHAVYRLWGYKRLGALRPFDTAPLYDAMLLNLR